MDHKLRPECNSQAALGPASSSIPTSTSTLGLSTGPAAMATQRQNPFDLSPAQTNPSLSSQSSSVACTLQTSIPQPQSLPRSLSETSGPTISVNATASKTQAVPASGSAPALQPGVENYPHQINDMGGPTATAPFLQDFSLVSEAAKRAQMAVVMRDLESVTL